MTAPGCANARKRSGSQRDREIAAFAIFRDEEDEDVEDRENRSLDACRRFVGRGERRRW
jgi:hypothetical protein